MLRSNSLLLIAAVVGACLLHVQAMPSVSREDSDAPAGKLNRRWFFGWPGALLPLPPDNRAAYVPGTLIWTKSPADKAAWEQYLKQLQHQREQYLQVVTSQPGPAGGAAPEKKGK